MFGQANDTEERDDVASKVGSDIGAQILKIKEHIIAPISKGMMNLLYERITSVHEDFSLEKALVEISAYSEQVAEFKENISNKIFKADDAFMAFVEEFGLRKDVERHLLNMIKDAQLEMYEYANMHMQLALLKNAPEHNADEVSEHLKKLEIA